MTLHLSRDEWERIAADGEGVLFRAAEYVEPHPRKGTVPPAEFVEAAKPCETCNGHGTLYEPNGPLPDPYDCPDCLGGKRRIAAMVPCYCKPIREAGKSWPYGDCLVPEPCTDGLVTVGHVVVEWGPLVVVDPMAQNPSLRHTAWVEVYGNQDKIGRQALVFLTPPPSKSIDITAAIPSDVDPQSLVGQYALGIKVVEP